MHFISITGFAHLSLDKKKLVKDITEEKESASIDPYKAVEVLKDSNVDIKIIAKSAYFLRGSPGKFSK
jgi:hypothetical protein